MADDRRCKGERRGGTPHVRPPSVKSRVELYFLRHGIAIEPDEWSGSDFDRPLTVEGRARMASEAKSIAKLGLDLDCIITSPLLRAKQTAEIVAGESGISDRVVEDARLGPHFKLELLASILNERVKASAIMLVAHEPTLARTIGSLVGGARIDVKKGALALVKLSDPLSLKGQLVWLVPPRVLIGYTEIK